MCLRSSPRVAVLRVKVGEVVDHVDEVLVQLGDLSVMFLNGRVELADVLTRCASRDEVCSVEISWHVESLLVDNAYETEEKASPGLDCWLLLWGTEPLCAVIGAFKEPELEVLSGEDDGAQCVNVWRLNSLDVVAEERLDEEREEVALSFQWKAHDDEEAHVKLETIRPLLNLTPKGRSHKRHPAPRLSE
eukprot:806316-Rhodomonas_salina.3